MDNSTVLLIAVIGVLVVVLVGIWLFRKGNVDARVNLPGGIGANVKGSQPQTPAQPRAIETGDIKAGKNAKVTDETESGIKTGGIEAGENAEVTAKARPSDETPKSGSPAATSGVSSSIITGDISSGRDTTVVAGDYAYTGDSNVDTGGGAYVAGDVTTGGDFVGRDKVTHGDDVRGDKISTGGIGGDANVAIGRGASACRQEAISAEELSTLFAPILAAVQAAPQANQAEALDDIKKLQEEVAKGDGADDQRVAGLVDGLVDLVPGAAAAVVSAFASPILVGVAGPATQYVLNRIRRT